MTCLVVGDLHGNVARLERFLERHGEESRWLFVGDLVDRGHQPPDAGWRVIRRIMGLPNAACLLGNHDALILGVLDEVRGSTFPAALKRGWRSLAECWLHNGGHWADLRALADDPEAEAWLRGLDAMTMVGDTLVQHADSISYLEYGDQIGVINDRVRAAVATHPYRVFGHLLDRHGFRDKPNIARRYLARFGAQRVVHGHSSHAGMEPAIDCEGACINVDGREHDTGALLVLDEGRGEVGTLPAARPATR